MCVSQSNILFVWLEGTCCKNRVLEELGNTKYKSALTLHGDIEGCSHMKGTNTGDQAQSGDQSQAPLEPHYFTVTLQCP